MNKIQEAANAATEAGQNPEIDYTIYALFTKHKYEVSFWNGKDIHLTSVPVLYGECLDKYMPDLMPVHPEESKLDVYKSYRFLGFSRNDNNMVVTKESDAQLVDYSMLFSVTDYRFYAVYIEVDVHDKATNLDLFNFTKETYTDTADSAYNITGYVVSPKSSSISGKITLPTTYKGSDGVTLPVIGVESFNESGVTHVFWNNPDGDNPNLRLIRSSAFQSTGIQFFEFTSKLRFIGQSAFYARSMITDERCIALLGESPILYIGADAFNSAFGFTNIALFKLRGTIQTIEAHAFLFQTGVNGAVGVLQIGSQEEPSVLQICGTVNVNDDGSKSTYAGIRPSDSSNYTSYFTTCQVYKKTGVFNDEIIDQSAPLIYGVGSWSVQSI